MKFALKLLICTTLLCTIGFTGCKSAAKREKARQEVLKKKEKEAKVDERNEPKDVDFDAFLGRLRKAVTAHDVQTIAGMMTTNFGYSLNPEKSGEGVFQYWDENNLWPELEGMMAEKFQKKGVFMVAPPQFADPSLNYDGYRAGIMRVNGSWKFAYFVNG